MDRDFKGIWIPKKIWLSKELTVMEKIFYVEIDSLDNENGCFASNAYFSEFFELSKRRVSQIINSLVEKGYIESIVYFKEGSNQIDKRVLRTLTPWNKSSIPPGTKVPHPMEKKCAGNNTSNNTINKNNMPDFDKFWNLYDYKTGKDKAIKAWKRIFSDDKKKIFEVLPAYIQSTPNKQFRKHPATWLNGKHWEDEIIQPISQQPENNKASEQTDIVAQAVKNLGMTPYPKFNDPITKKVILKMNWETFRQCRTDKIPFLLKDFTNNYRNEAGA